MSDVDLLDYPRHVWTERGKWGVMAAPAPTVGRGVARYAFTSVEEPRAPRVVATLEFQDGPFSEVGVNGATNETVIAAVIDRLEQFQASAQTRCRENALAIAKLEEALHWLNHRTADRTARGVEGTYEK